jgi:hypothetical protein
MPSLFIALLTLSTATFATPTQTGTLASTSTGTPILATVSSHTESDFKIIKKIGSGLSARAFLAQPVNKNSQKVVLKVSKTSETDYLLLNERKVMKVCAGTV